MTRKRRNAMTLVELLMAMAITTFVGLATATMLRATSYATTNRQGLRTLLVRAQTVESRFASAVHAAVEIVVPDNTTPTQADYVILWMGDANADGAKQNSEMALIDRSSSTNVLTYYRSTTASGNYSSASTYRTAALAGYPADRWAGNVTSWSTTVVDASTEYPLLTCKFTLDDGSVAQTMQGAACPRK